MEDGEEEEVDIELVFPIEVTMDVDASVVTVNSEEELDTIYESCEE